MNRREFLKAGLLGASIAALPKSIANIPHTIEIVDIQFDWNNIILGWQEPRIEGDKYICVLKLDNFEEHVKLIDSTGRKWTLAELKELAKCE